MLLFFWGWHRWFWGSPAKLQVLWCRWSTNVQHCQDVGVSVASSLTLRHRLGSLLHCHCLCHGHDSHDACPESEEMPAASSGAIGGKPQKSRNSQADSIGFKGYMVRNRRLRSAPQAAQLRRPETPPIQGPAPVVIEVRRDSKWKILLVIVASAGGASLSMYLASVSAICYSFAFIPNTQRTEKFPVHLFLHCCSGWDWYQSERSSSLMHSNCNHSLRMAAHKIIQVAQLVIIQVHDLPAYVDRCPAG